MDSVTISVDFNANIFILPTIKPRSINVHMKICRPFSAMVLSLTTSCSDGKAVMGIGTKSVLGGADNGQGVIGVCAVIERPGIKLS